jgi:hypothetical protein
MRFETSIHRVRGSKRHLLFEDDADKRREAGATAPNWWITYALEHTRQIGIARGEMRCALTQSRAGQYAAEHQSILRPASRFLLLPDS